jgi:hypothetical protein
VERQVALRSLLASGALAFAAVATARAAGGALPFSGAPAATGGYAVAGSLAAVDAPTGTAVSFYGRAPTKTEMAPSPGADGFFFFHMDLGANAPVHVAGGSTIDVAFPSKLDPSYRYSMTLARTVPNVVDVPGTLHGNTLHFELPAFVVPANTRIIGEIDGDPPKD